MAVHVFCTDFPASFIFTKSKNGKRILIIGAGDAAERLLREMRQNPNIDYDIVGFLDNNPAKKGRRIHDVPILGQIDDIEEIGSKRKNRRGNCRNPIDQRKGNAQDNISVR